MKVGDKIIVTGPTEGGNEMYIGQRGRICKVVNFTKRVYICNSEKMYMAKAHLGAIFTASSIRLDKGHAVLELINEIYGTDSR